MKFDMGEEAERTEIDELPEESDAVKDLLPEQLHYRDEGCELAGSCLDCPFDECIYDKPGGKRRWKQKERAAEMVRLFTEEGKTINELAEMFGVSKRTVQRALKSAPANKRKKQE